MNTTIEVPKNTPWPPGMIDKILSGDFFQVLDFTGVWRTVCLYGLEVGNVTTGDRYYLSPKNLKTTRFRFSEPDSLDRDLVILVYENGGDLVSICPVSAVNINALLIGKIAEADLDQCKKALWSEGGYVGTQHFYYKTMKLSNVSVKVEDESA